MNLDLIYSSPSSSPSLIRKRKEESKRNKEKEMTGSAPARKRDRRGRGKEKSKKKMEPNKTKDYYKEIRDSREDVEGHEAWYAAEFRQHWEHIWGDDCGKFEDTTSIPPMRFTDEPEPYGLTNVSGTLQFYTVKVRQMKDCLQWPLHVFGIVALRDSLDHNRNIIFNRTRDNCQTITQEDPYLELTGPSRAVVVCDPVEFEVVLKVKGATESEDKELSFLVMSFRECAAYSGTAMIRKAYTSKLSTVEFAYGYVSQSVEATISVKVIGGSWPDAYHGRFVASIASIDNYQVDLLNRKDGKVPLSGDGMVELSRRVASVEYKGKLIVGVFASAWDSGSEMTYSDVKKFKPKLDGRSHKVLDVGFCKMEVTIGWSLFKV